MPFPNNIIFSNFANAKKHSGTKYSIAFYSPKYIVGFRELPLLFPTQEMLHAVKSGEINRDEYKDKYNNLLKERHSRIGKLLERIPNGAVMCCYCDLKSEGSFCHRQLAALYLSEHFEIDSIVE